SGANKNSSADRREVERSRDVCDPLRSSAGHFLDWSDEIYRIRGERHPTTGSKQSNYAVALWVSQRTGIFKCTWGSGNCHCSNDWASLAIAASVGCREHAGDTDVSNDAELLIFDTRLGAQLGRIPGFSGRSGTILVKRHRITRRVYLVPGRVAGIHRCLTRGSKNPQTRTLVLCEDFVTQTRTESTSALKEKDSKNSSSTSSGSTCSALMFVLFIDSSILEQEVHR